MHVFPPSDAVELLLNYFHFFIGLFTLPAIYLLSCLMPWVKRHMMGR